MLIFDTARIKKFIEGEYDTLKETMIANIASSGKKASGKTGDSIHTEVDDSDGIAISLVGRDGINYLETGNPPGVREGDFVALLYKWSQDKGLEFRNSSSRFWFSANAAFKITQSGDEQYRNGEFVNIYSSYLPGIMDRVEQEVENEMQDFIDKIAI